MPDGPEDQILDGAEYREKLIAHAHKRGYGPSTQEDNKWVFTTDPPGRTAVVEFEPRLTEKKGYLVWAKGILTSEQNVARGIFPKQNPIVLLPGLPTQELDDEWLGVFSPKYTVVNWDTEAGKWLMFIRESFVDETWANVFAAVREGRLAHYAKISTKAVHDGNQPYVLCVYIPDYRDRVEARAVRERLRTLGFKRIIPFRRDAMTLAGESESEFMA